MAKKINERYNHSYTHCSGNDCSIKSDCVHYLAFQEAIEMELDNFKVTGHCKDPELEYVRVRVER